MTRNALAETDRNLRRGFAANLKLARNKRSLTQLEAAALCGINPFQWSFYEVGTRAPGLKNLKAICEGLGTSADWLLDL